MANSDDDSFISGLLKDEGRKMTRKSKYSLRKHLAYKFEAFLVSAKHQLYFFLILLACVSGVFGSLLYSLGGMYGDSYGDTSVNEAIWQSWNIIIDAGIEFFVQGTPNRAVAGLITISGVLFASMLTGFVVDGVKEQLEGVRRGRQAVNDMESPRWSCVACHSSSCSEHTFSSIIVF